MLGIVFTEFADMVEEKFSPEFLDELLEACHESLGSGGAYTAVGNYDHNEILVIVSEMARKLNVSVDELVRSYGRHLFGVFTKKYPGFFEGVNDSMSFLMRVETHIHKEVLKLYHTAELPTLDCQLVTEDSMRIEYRSSRPFSALALGLIEGCAEYFDESIQIESQDLSNGKMNHSLFLLQRG